MAFVGTGAGGVEDKSEFQEAVTYWVRLMISLCTPLSRRVK
jgi:hypothetical protein